MARGKLKGVAVTSEFEMAEEAARHAIKKLHAYLSGRSKDHKGAKEALRAINQHTRLRNKQNAVDRLKLRALRTLKRNRKGGA